MGRTAEIDRLRSRMRQNHFVAISGPRNCGKSRVCKELKKSLESEVRNMREDDQKFKAKAGMRWKVAYIRLTREDSPFDLLARAIAGPGSDILVGPNEKVDPLFESNVKAALKDPEGEGLLMIYQRYLQYKQFNFLVIVDQLENLFFSTILNQEEKHLFVKMLLNSSFRGRQIYVTVALRPPKADLWKHNFRVLNDAIESCLFRLYNPNQVELEDVIANAFIQEKERILSEVGDDDLFRPEWLENQDIYKKVAHPRVKAIAESLHTILKPKWKKVLKKGKAEGQQLVPTSNVTIITKQLRGVVDAIWPELLRSSNIGNLEDDERNDLVEDLKIQLTDVLTAELLRKLSRMLAEELYFEKEPLVQIEKHVRQLVKDWANVMNEIRQKSKKKKREIVTILSSNQNSRSGGSAFGDFKVNMSLPVEKRAEEAYEALNTVLDKRIARKVLIIMGTAASVNGSTGGMTIDSLIHAIGRFSAKIPEVMKVFVNSAVVVANPDDDLTPATQLAFTDGDIINKWSRLSEWVFGTNQAESSSSESKTNYQTSQESNSEPEIHEITMEIPEFTGDASDTAELASRAESIYQALNPSIKKRVAKLLFKTLYEHRPDGNGIGQKELFDHIGKFEDMLKEISEIFIRQNILSIDNSGIRFTDIGLAKSWENLSKWIKE